MIEKFFLSAKSTSTGGKYKRAARYAGIWIGDGLKWRSWIGARVEFNPSRVSHAGIDLVSELFAESRDVRFTRVDVAVDLSVSLRAVQPLGTRSKKASAVWSDSIETIYIGDRNAARSFAIYDKRNEMHRHDGRSRIPGDMTRFEARLKKLKLKPGELLEIKNPFHTLQLLWLGGDDLSFLDRVLVRLASVAGLPLLLKELPAKRFEKLRQKLADEARKRRVPHPRDAFDEAWGTEAERVLNLLGLST